jgi:hypothetical protein
VLGPLASSETLTPAVLADRAVRVLLPHALDARAAGEAASRIRALPELTDAETARTTMPALERVARATQAPADLIRAASQCAGALLRTGLPGGAEVGEAQLAAAAARLVLAGVRAGRSPQELVSLLV